MFFLPKKVIQFSLYGILLADSTPSMPPLKPTIIILLCPHQTLKPRNSLLATVPFVWMPYDLIRQDDTNLKWGYRVNGITIRHHPMEVDGRVREILEGYLLQ